MRSRLSVLLALGLCCAHGKRIPARRPISRDARGVLFLPLVGSTAELFTTPEGRPCGPFDGRVRDALAGWSAGDSEDPACSHDSLYEGQRAGVLELMFRGPIPGAGDWRLGTLEYPVGAWGRVVCRGKWNGDDFARARVKISAASPHCSASWSSQLAGAQVSGPMVRGASFAGYVEIPDLFLAGCRKGDLLEVRVQLLAEVTRGVVDVDWFGFSASSSDDVNRIVGLLRSP